MTFFPVLDSLANTASPMRDAIATTSADAVAMASGSSPESANWWNERRLATSNRIERSKIESFVGARANPDGPKKISGLKSVKSISYNNGLGCAVTSSGTVKCWGIMLCNFATDCNNDLNVAVTIPKLKGVKSVGVGWYHACALLVSGTVKCWGSNSSGQLGDRTDYDSDLPVSVRGLKGVRQLEVGHFINCAVLKTNQVKCWGNSQYGELYPSGTNPGFPKLIPGLGKVKQISIGSSHMCARMMTNQVKCWGRGDNGQLGNGEWGKDATFATPVIVKGLAGVIEVASGGDHSCALLKNRTVKCWGSNHYGQLGNRTDTPSPTPVLTRNLSNVATIRAGFDSTCAVTLKGTAKCWGDNYYHQIDGSIGDKKLEPVKIAGIAKATLIDVGVAATCAVLKDKSVRCWGSLDTRQV